jgi:hypothetical protein
MPPPPSRRYATPASEFGIAKPVNEWFDFAAAGSPQTGPSFSRGLDEADTRATQRELESIRLQRELQGEQAASDFLAQAAGQNPRGLMQMLADSPELLTSGAAPAIQDYVATRMAQQQEQQAKRNQFSSKVLAPSLMKSLPPEQQLRLSRKIDAGKSITDAFDELEAEEMQQTASAKMRQLALDAAKAGANPQDISTAMQSPDPELFLAALSGKRATGGRTAAGRFKQEDLEKAGDYMLGLEEQGITKEDPRYQRAKARFDAIEMALDEDIFGAPAIPNQATPVGATAAPGAAAAGAATTEPKVAATAEPAAPTLPPLGKFEETQEKRTEAASQPAMLRRKALDAAWTGAKDKAIADLLPDSGIDPQRVMSLAQQAILGNPLTGVTQQEKQFAEQISRFAQRAAEGKGVQVGQRVVQVGAGGEGYSEPVMRSPGYVLLEQYGMNPNEEVVIPGGGFMFGGDKPMKAYEVMDLRLKEIAQPLLQQRKENQPVQERAKLSSGAADILNKELGK